ncbi:MAG: hypothetical protein ACOH2A_14460 [Sphingobacteriaceae bacterium]
MTRKLTVWSNQPKKQHHAQIDTNAPSIKRYGKLQVFWNDPQKITTAEGIT